MIIFKNPNAKAWHIKRRYDNNLSYCKLAQVSSVTSQRRNIENVDELKLFKMCQRCLRKYESMYSGK